MIGRSTARAGAVPAIAGLVGLLWLAAADAATSGARHDPAPRAILIDGRDLFLEVVVSKGDSAATLGRTYLEDPRLFPAVRGLQAQALPPPGGIIRIPYELLHPDWAVRVVRDLFPADRPGDGYWVHQVGAGRLTVTEESLWNLSLWFTGRGENFAAIADRNGLHDLAPRPGQPLIVPGDLLLPPFARLAGLPPSEAPLDDDFSSIVTQRAPAARPDTGETATPGERAPQAAAPEPAAPPASGATGNAGPQQPPGKPEGTLPPSSPAPVSAEGSDELSYGSDADGPYAIYRLKRGEAIYSAVVVRFTGRLDAADVNELAADIIRRSRIADVKDIAVGHPIKIALDHLLPEYLPPGDPRRVAWEKSEAGVARYTNPARSRDLEGVAVILDAGHGGRDRGAAHNGVWEHDYVYDILCRIKHLLEKETRARVLTTIRDREEGYAIRTKTKVRRSQAEVLLTDPPYPLQPGTMSVNLRWYLANSYHRALVEEGFDPLKIVFTSLHADARHPSLSGAMVYVPGEEYRRGRYGNGGARYAKYSEVRQAPFVSFSRPERERSEALSREFATSFIEALQGAEIPVYQHSPIRERIIRRGRSWVPAVLRCNIVPVEVLIEICNLSNNKDSQRLGKPSFRQKVAEAYVEALRNYYDGAEAPVTAGIAAGR